MKKQDNYILNLCDIMCKYIHKSTINFISLYEIEYKNLLFELNLLYNSEPSKIFKNKYKLWEENIRNKEKEINEVLRKLNSELKELKYD